MTYHMKRKDKEITDTKAQKRILKSTKYVTIALSKENRPYLATLSHGYDESRNCIYFHCAREGKKLDYIRSNDNVWGQAMLDYGYAEGKCDHIYASVQFQGKVTLIDKTEEKRKAAECMMRQLDKNPEVLITEIKMERLENTVFGRIDISYMTGKKSEEATLS